MQHMAFPRSLASPSVSEQRDTSHQQVPQQPTSSSSGLQELQGFSLRWESLSETMKGKSDSKFHSMGPIGAMINRCNTNRQTVVAMHAAMYPLHLIV